MIRTVAQLIDALGGPDATVEALKMGEKGKKALSNWKVSNDLPLWVRIEVGRIASANRLIIDPALIGPKRRLPYGTGKCGKKIKTKSRRRAPTYATAAE